MQHELIAGDSLNFLTTLAAYPAPTWVLKFRLIPRTAANPAIALTAVAEGVDHRVTSAATVTATWAADTYTWTSWVERAAEVYSVESGQIVIKANPRTAAAGYDGRTQAEKALDQAKAALAAWTPTTRKYRIGDREMEFAGKADIIGIVSYWQNEIARERRAAALSKGLADPRKTYVRLGRM